VKRLTCLGPPTAPFTSGVYYSLLTFMPCVLILNLTAVLVHSLTHEPPLFSFGCPLCFGCPKINAPFHIVYSGHTLCTLCTVVTHCVQWSVRSLSRVCCFEIGHVITGSIFENRHLNMVFCWFGIIYLTV
jgi:hypothetical protein